MKRRDLIKTAISIPVVAGLSGCNSTPYEIADDEELRIEPKQTKPYEFSIALPFNFETIDGLYELNQKYKKSKIVTLYNSMFSPFTKNYDCCMHRTDFHAFQKTNANTLDDFKKYAKYAMDKGFKICYLLNATKPMSKSDFNSFKKEFHTLLDFLANTGINEIKVANTQTATLVNEYNPNFKLSASTAFEFHSIAQYKNLIQSYPNMELVDVAIDENYNFRFLNNLKKMYPNLKVEVMINEGCDKGCPARISHNCTEYARFNCYLLKKPIYLKYVKDNFVYPWFLPYYQQIGVNNFKCLCYPNGRNNFHDLSYFNNYLKIVEFGYDSIEADTLFNKAMWEGYKVINKKIMVKDIIRYLPDIKHIIKHGYKCAYECGTECQYCDNQARKLEKAIEQLSKIYS